MKDSSEELKQALSYLLEERLPICEVSSLKEQGFKIKKPTRMTAVLIALYKKAVSGDLSAIKELRSILSGTGSDFKEGAVTIVDDIPS